jgi:8-oxo-dGTP pyrophosphatase MutT (NUDIX family)
MAAIPKKATTIILLREKKAEGFEVFLLKRHEKSSFMAGNFVYPGGRVDRSDGSKEISCHCKGVTFEEAHKIMGGSISPDESFAHWVAGIRELFEEAGVILAYDRSGSPFSIKNQIQQERFLNYRTLLQKGNLTLLQIAQEEEILFALDQLHYYAHWITPEAFSERFNTRFFLALHPVGQEANYDQKETTAGIWITPQKALEENLKGKVILSPPTLITLKDLFRFKSMEDLFNSLKNKEIRPVLPFLTKILSETIIVYPWDPEYEAFQRGEFPVHMNHGRPSQSGDYPTRLILKEGIWHPYCYSG